MGDVRHSLKVSKSNQQRSNKKDFRDDFGDLKTLRYSLKIVEYYDLGDFNIPIITGCLIKDGILEWIEEVEELFESVNIILEEAKLVAKRFK